MFPLKLQGTIYISYTSEHKIMSVFYLPKEIPTCSIDLPPSILYIVGATRKKKAGGRSKKKSQGSEDEAGEETDEGDMESREVDYMSDSSSASEQEFQVSTSHVIVM